MALSDRLYHANQRSNPLKSDAFAKRLWHGYCLSSDEVQQINQLMGRALLDAKFCDRLVNQRDKSVFGEYAFTPETESWLVSIEARDLTEFAQAVTAVL
ncbi:MAG: hypothetical protein IAE80_28260 [Anaerolinea sp.]|nr:hypothetical protein [Anaerolinea sp.]